MFITILNIAFELVRVWFVLTLSAGAAALALRSAVGVNAATNELKLLAIGVVCVPIGLWAAWLYRRFRKDSTTQGRHFRKPYGFASVISAAGMAVLLVRALVLTL
jgi:hypothetical protein